MFFSIKAHFYSSSTSLAFVPDVDLEDFTYGHINAPNPPKNILQNLYFIDLWINLGAASDWACYALTFGAFMNRLYNFFFVFFYSLDILTAPGWFYILKFLRLITWTFSNLTN